MWQLFNVFVIPLCFIHSPKTSLPGLHSWKSFSKSVLSLFFSDFLLDFCYFAERRSRQSIFKSYFVIRRSYRAPQISHCVKSNKYF